MTPKDKFSRLAHLLYSKTVSKELDWSSDANGLYARVGENYIQLADGKNSDGEPIAIVIIRNNNYQEVDRFNDDIFAGESPIGFQYYWQMMSATKEMANRQAIGADEAIDSILSQLGGDGEAPL